MTTSLAARLPSHLPVRTLGAATIVFGYKNGKYPDGNQVLVQGADSCVAFDMPKVSLTMGEVLASIDEVILGHVHEDHMVGLPQVPQARVWVHERDVAAARSLEGLRAHYSYPDSVWLPLKDRVAVEFHHRPRPDARAYVDGQRWDVGGGVSVHAVHLPGHTSGHCALVIEPQGLAFIGDIDLSSFGPYYGDGTSSLAEFRRTLAKVRALPASGWITSHHKGLVTDRAEFLRLLDAFGSRLDERSDALLDMLGERPHSLDELVKRRVVYPAEHVELWVDVVERRSIEQHLDELVQAGRVVRAGDLFARA